MVKSVDLDQKPSDPDLHRLQGRANPGSATQTHLKWKILQLPPSASKTDICFELYENYPKIGNQFSILAYFAGLVNVYQ